MKKLFSFIAVLSLLLTSCDGFDLGGSIGKLDDLIAAVDSEKLDGFSADGGSVSLPFTPQYDWEASANRAWIQVSPESGVAGEETQLVVSLEENTTDKEREGTIFIELSNSTTYKLPVRQKSKNSGTTEETPVVELENGAYYEINSNGGEIKVKLNTNTNYEVNIPQNASAWLSLANTRAMRSETLTFTAKKNEGSSSREAKIVLSYGNNSKVEFTIYQVAAQQDNTVLELVNGASYSIVPEGGDIDIKVLSNVAYSVEIPTEASWLHENKTRTATESTVSLYAERNNSGATRSAVVKLTANNNSVSFTVSQDSVGGGNSDKTPGEHQEYLEQLGHKLLAYFNPEDSRALATSVSELAEAGGFDFYLESTTTRSTSSTKNSNVVKELGASIMGITRFSPDAAVRLSATLILPGDDGSYNLDDYKGKQYIFNYQTGRWKESVLSSENKIIAIWGTSVATLTWEDGTNSWEGFIDYDYKAKVENIPSKINFEISVDNKVELTSAIEISLPTNYSIETKTAVSLNGGYNFSVCADADRRGVSGSVVVSKGTEKLATGGGSVLINDLTDSKNWFAQYTEEWFDGYEWHNDTYTDLNWDYPVDQVKSGEAYATVLDVGLNAQGDLRKIIDEGKKIEDTESYDGATLLSNYINANASALLYYTDSQQKIADIKAEPVADEYWDWDNNTQTEVLKTYYIPMPVLVFTDNSKFAVDQYFTEVAFGNLIDAAEALLNKYIDLVD